MDARVVSAGQGWQWIVDGFALFRKNPGIWIALTVVVALLWGASFLVPVFGPLLFNLLFPVLFAGLMMGCQALEQGEELELAHLFAGFRQHASALVTIGGVYLVGTILVLGTVLVVSGGSMLAATLSKSPTDLQMIMGAMRSVMLGLLVGLAFYIPLIMLAWFAPLLVVFHGMAPVAAMKSSFSACLKNIVPFLIYGIVIVVLWVLASIPLLLGLLVLLPVIFCSVYASYKDIYSVGSVPAAGGDNPLLR
ncbi:MAG: hypothetical protein HY323_04770 [Betaproteobacteria bacterium]|nr:hypothetical protein [Betaproteobacteria bacterium]